MANSDSAESDNEDLLNRLMSEKSISSGEDELYSEESESEDVFETTTSTITDVLNESEVKGLFSEVERGPAPTNLKRRSGTGLHRDTGNEKTSRKQCRRYDVGKGTENEQLIGLPADLGWSAKVPRRRRNIDFSPNDKPGVSGIAVDEGPAEIFLKLAEPFLRKCLQYTNDKREELGMKEIDWDDMLSFAACHVWMGTRQLPRISDYFSNDPYLQDKFLTELREKSGFSSNKLRTIFKTVRLYDKTKSKESGLSDPQSTNYDPAYKYKEVLKEFTQASQKYFKPFRELAIDESMDLFKVGARLKGGL